MKTSSKKRILIIAESINAEDSSGSKANVSLIQNLSKAGFEVLVYHFTRKNIQLNNIKCISIKEKRSGFLFIFSRIQRKLQHNLKINLAKHLEPLFGFSFTFLNDSSSIVAGLKTEIDYEPDLVLTLSKGASFRPHHALLNLPEFHHRWMAYIHDPYPFHYYPAPYHWSEPGYRQKIDFFEEVAAKCQWAGYPSLYLAKWMEDHYMGFKNKRVVIPHQLNKEKTETRKILPNWFDPSRFNVLHAGNLLKQRDPFPLIQAFQEFLSKNPEAKMHARLLVIGSASYHFHNLKKKDDKIEELFVSDGYVAYEEVLAMQENASVNVILESVAEISPFLPGKFPHCVAANKTILYLGPEKSEVRRLLGSEYNYCSEANDTEKISITLERLYFEWKLNPESLKLNRKDLQEYLNVAYLKEQISCLT